MSAAATMHCGGGSGGSVVGARPRSTAVTASTSSSSVARSLTRHTAV